MAEKNNTYIELTFQVTDPRLSEILLASLTATGFEGFEEGDNYLKAYIPYREYEEKKVNALSESFNIPFTLSEIKEKNWNDAWESQYEPVIVDGLDNLPWVGIRADFHEPFTKIPHELIITPKMSFGTGHHATTFMMIQQMQAIDFHNKKVMDLGTGTGVLAILAEKLGAATVIAIDNDEWCIENSAENIERNRCSRIELRSTGPGANEPGFDVILANINKNIIIDYLPRLASLLLPGGILLLSGLLEEDQGDIESAGAGFGLKTNRIIKRNNWISIRLDC